MKLPNIIKSSFFKIILLVYVLLVFWWLYLNLLSEPSSEHLQLWAANYQILAILGLVVGFIASFKWGGLKSLIGKSIFAFSLGLLMQVLGQSIYSFYIYFLNVEIPYPSAGDIGFFGSIPCYIYGTWSLAKISGIKVSLKNISSKIYFLVIPIILLSMSYLTFLSKYEFDWSNPLTVFLDFAYPIGQALYVSIAILAYILSTNILGGIMKTPILLIISALVFQYISDFIFLYQASQDNWSAGGINDLMYATSYLVMAIGLTYMKIIWDFLNKKSI